MSVSASWSISVACSLSEMAVTPSDGQADGGAVVQPVSDCSHGAHEPDGLCLVSIRGELGELSQ